MTTTPSNNDIAILLAEAAARGINLQELAQAQSSSVLVAEYVDRVLPTARRGQEHTYGPYLRVFADLHGQRGLTSITLTDVTAFC